MRHQSAGQPWVGGSPPKGNPVEGLLSTLVLIATLFEKGKKKRISQKLVLSLSPDERQTKVGCTLRINLSSIFLVLGLILSCKTYAQTWAWAIKESWSTAADWILKCCQLLQSHHSHNQFKNEKRNWQLKLCPASISAGENQRNFHRVPDAGLATPITAHNHRALISII